MKKIAVTFMLLMGLGGLSALSAKVIATVNGYPVTLEEANAFVKAATRGKVKYSQLKPKDKRRVIQSIATDKLVIKTAWKSLSQREKEFVVADYWVRKNAAKIKVSNKEIKEAYRKNRRLFKNRKTGKIVPFKKVKALVKLQLQQKKFVQSLMKKAKIDYHPAKAKKSSTKSKK